MMSGLPVEKISWPRGEGVRGEDKTVGKKDTLGYLLNRNMTGESPMLADKKNE